MRIEVEGLNIEIAKDNEPYLIDLVEKVWENLRSEPIIGGTFRSTDLRRRVLNVRSASQKKEYTPIG